MLSNLQNPSGSIIIWKKKIAKQFLSGINRNWGNLKVLAEVRSHLEWFLDTVEKAKLVSTELHLEFFLSDAPQIKEITVPSREKFTFDFFS